MNKSIIFVMALLFLNIGCTHKEDNTADNYISVVLPLGEGTCKDACVDFSNNVCKYCSLNWVEKQVGKDCYCKFTSCNLPDMKECIKEVSNAHQDKA